MTLKKDLLDRIRERAFALWEGEGKPEGRHEEHWRQASSEIETPPAAHRPARRTVKSRQAAADAPAPKAAAAKGQASAKTTAALAGSPQRKPRSRKSAAPDA